ncbi:MAG: hypothetical protein FJX67_19355 [Alphaproteobacteria bacterium]|nr:hypothetical protein [Alphaproteobacteria bacterium]
MRILQAVPDGLLWLLAPGPVAERNLRRAMTARGVDPDRLVIAPRRIEKEDHLARLALADLALDTRIYTGHVTTCDALWMGVPVITMRGEHFPGRVAASALRAVGLAELVTGSLDDYCARAIRLAQSPPARAAIRQQLMTTRGRVPLFDSARYVRNLERTFRQIWRRACDGLAPVAIDVDESDPT